jgi:hypothetical protein
MRFPCPPGEAHASRPARNGDGLSPARAAPYTAGMQRRARTVAIFTLLLFVRPGEAATPSDRAWIARCMAQLAEAHADAKERRIYCTCMHENFSDNEPATQSEMEHMFPPLHLYCRRQAGW